MKKAKIILTAIAVFTVVGGTLAFKANKMNGNLYCTTVEKSACNTDVTYTATTVIPGSQQLYCSLSSQGADGCKTIDITTRVKVDQ